MTKRITKATKPAAPYRLRMVAIDAEQDGGRFQLVILKAKGAAAIETGMRLVKAAIGKP